MPRLFVKRSIDPEFDGMVTALMCVQPLLRANAME
jgi:hypothetical protein